MTEGGVDETGVFHEIPRIDDSRLAEVFAREVLAFLVGRELLSPEWAERLLSWRHTGFSVHSRVRAKTKPEAERVGQYMIRPVLSLERLSFLSLDQVLAALLILPPGALSFLTGPPQRDPALGQV